jgi:hypothetical protein
LPSARGPDGEEEDHASLLTRSPGFESWSGCWKRRAVSSAGQSASMTRWRPQVRPLHRPLGPTIRKGHPIGDGTRLESGRALSLAGSNPAPSAPEQAGGSGRSFDGVRGVTGAREPVELEATGSTPAGHPHHNPGGDDDVKRAGDTFRGVLPGEQRASKTRGQGSTPCAPADRRRGRTVRRLPCKQVHAGSSPAVGFNCALGV